MLWVILPDPLKAIAPNLFLVIGPWRPPEFEHIDLEFPPIPVHGKRRRALAQHSAPSIGMVSGSNWIAHGLDSPCWLDDRIVTSACAAFRVGYMYS